MIWAIGSIITFIVVVASSTIYYLRHNADKDFDMECFSKAVLAISLIASGLSWVSIVTALVSLITYKTYTKYIGNKNEKQN